MRVLQLIPALLIALCTSCNLPDLKAWPIPELTLPSSAVPARMPSFFISGAYGEAAENGTQLVPNQNSTSWGRGFDYFPGWDALVKHVDGQLRPQGYHDYTGQGLASLPRVPGYSADRIARGWEAPDGKYIVVLVNCGFAAANGAAQLQGDSDYIIVIDLAKL